MTLIDILHCMYLWVFGFSYAVSFVGETVFVSEPNGHSAQRPTQDRDATTNFQTVRIIYVKFLSCAII